MGLVIGVSACVGVGCAIKKARERKKKKLEQDLDDDFYKPVDRKRESMKRRKMDEDWDVHEGVVDATTFDTINGVPITPDFRSSQNGSMRNRKHRSSHSKRDRENVKKKKFLNESDDERLNDEFIISERQAEVTATPVAIKNAHNKKKHGHRKQGSDAQNLVLGREGDDDVFQSKNTSQSPLKVQPVTRHSQFKDDSVKPVSTEGVILTNVGNDTASVEDFVLPTKKADIRLSIREGDKGTVFKLYAKNGGAQEPHPEAIRSI